MVLSLVVDLGIDESHYYFFATADMKAWISVVYLSAVSTVVAYILFFYLIRTVGSVKQTMVGYLLPVFGVFEGAMFLKEWDGVEWWFIFCEVLGTLLICCGIAIVSFSLPEFITRPFSKFWDSLRGKKGNKYEQINDEQQAASEHTPLYTAKHESN